MNKTYVCADLHGMYDLWVQIRDFLDPTDTLYVLGDATDRGPDGWKLLKELLANPQVKYIKGNHDQMMIDCWREDFSDTYLWFRNGGYTTCCQMALDDEDIIKLYLTELDKKPYRDTYINKLGQTICLSHAGFTPGVRETDDPHQYIWDRDHVYDEVNFEKDVFVVHGHTPLLYLPESNLRLNDQETIGWYAGGHKIDIDNGCFMTHQIGLLDLDTWEDYTYEIKP
jgi:serine/threonine protein phosphatase 1